LNAILDRAVKLKAARAAAARPGDGALAGKTVALIFERPSTRTRMSAEIAVYELGGHPIVLSGDAMQLSRGESLRDTALVMERYVHAIGIRTGPHATVETLAEHAGVPVFNLLTEDHHPCQALADLLTLRERFGVLRGLKVAFVGDLGNVATSLAEAANLCGIDLVVACPPGYRRDVAGTTVTDDPSEAVRGANAVYTDVWVSMGDEAEAADRVRELAPYQVSERLMALAQPNAVFMHCLPAHRGEEVTAEVIDGPRSVVWQQAENRLPTEEAILYALIARTWALPARRLERTWR